MVIGKILGLILLMEMIVHGFRFEVVDGFRFDLVNGFRFVVNGFRFGAVDGLSMDYYLRRCPLAELIVKIKVIKALQADPTLAASLVRLHFHDCFIEGCDGSVLLNSTKQNKAERDSPANLSLRGFELIDEIKEELEKQCPGIVSCADILAMAARDAVCKAGGPLYDIPKGRMDGTRSKIEDTINLPAPTFNASQLINLFGQHSFSAQEMVALSGAHTLGVARCSSFKNRLVGGLDANLNADFAKTLFTTCSASDTAEQPFDETRNTFDNLYYRALQCKSGVLDSDQTLYASAETKGVVDSYASNKVMFFSDFKRAMVKMSMLNVKQGSQGEVRQNCYKIN